MDPISAGMMGISVLSSLFGGGSKASQQRTQGDFALQNGLLEQQSQDRQGDVADISAQQDLNNAEMARAEAGVMATEALMQGRAQAASGAVQAAANGGGLGGSSIGVLAHLANMSVFNARVQAYRGLTASNSDMADAVMSKYQGEMDRWGGQVSLYKGQQQKALDYAGADAAATEGLVGAAGAVFGGFGKAAAARRATSLLI